MAEQEFDSVYDPTKYEKKWWDTWIEKKLFHASPNAKKIPFTILMPPPNVTSQLHMGHGTCYTFMDILTRWKRMAGFEACWLPGTDHAGIATQMMVEKDLWAREKKHRQDLKREDFEALCQAWKEKYGNLIYQQFADIGFSADWDRKAYTMDPTLSHAVRFVFVQLYNEGLIYRAQRLVNWDTVLKTAISDDEVYTQEIQGHLWLFSYLVEGMNEPIVVATTRPETMLGDTAIAVNPDDERYSAYIGKKAKIPVTDRWIPIIADEYVKPEFGTGAVKITPAHDPNDFVIGKKHNLEFIEILDESGVICGPVPAEFKGLDRFDARKAVIRKAKELGFFHKEQNYKHAVPHSDRSKSVIEPKLSYQWYVRMAEMAKPAADAARENKISFYPDSWKKTYLYWLDNIQDWCISRQLWWGHRIPIWNCSDCSQITCTVETPNKCQHCGSAKILQDHDVLDTWFSSWLWPLSPFGWPEPNQQKKEGFDYFYPTEVLITAPEILFLWVARMVMAGIKFTGKIPFEHIYLAATVTDKQGRKFSKTLGNGIDPVEVIAKHGADAVRFTGVSMAPLGGRIPMEIGDFETGARFVNKIWNASRFVLTSAKIDTTKPYEINSDNLDLPSRWLLDRFAQTVEKVNLCFAGYRLNEAVDAIYHFIWDDFCDWGLEAAKACDPANRETSWAVLMYCLDGALRLIHPVMPFVSEEIWQKLPRCKEWDRPESICVAAFPNQKNLRRDNEACTEWQYVIDLIDAVRSVKQQVGIAPKEKVEIIIQCDNLNQAKVYENESNRIKRLANASSLSVGSDVEKPKNSLIVVGKGFQAFIPAGDLVDFEKEKTRMRAEIDRLGKIITGIESKLNNQSFVAKAPAEIIQQNKEQMANLCSQRDRLLCMVQD